MVTAVVDPEIGSIRNAPYLGCGPVPIGARLADLLNMPMQVRMLMPTIARGGDAVRRGARAQQHPRDALRTGDRRRSACSTAERSETAVFLPAESA